VYTTDIKTHALQASGNQCHWARKNPHSWWCNLNLKNHSVHIHTDPVLRFLGAVFGYLLHLLLLGTKVVCRLHWHVHCVCPNTSCWNNYERVPMGTRSFHHWCKLFLYSCQFLWHDLAM